MSEIRLEPVGDWSTVKAGDPVRLTNGGAQINALANNSAASDPDDTWVQVKGLEETFYKSEGWVLERPVQPEPLPTVAGSVIRVRMPGRLPAVFELSPAIGGDPQWVDDLGDYLSSATLAEQLLSWEWVRKPEALVVEETRKLILNDVLTMLDAYKAPADSFPGEIVSDLRNAVARVIVIAKAGS